MRARYAVFLMIFMLLGCASSPQKPPADTSLLVQRAQRYWEYRAKRDFEHSYKLEAPSVRAKYSLSRYIRSFGGVVRYKKVEVVDAKVEGTKATVRLRITLKLVIAPSQPLTTYVSDDWVWEKGNWYHLWAPKLSPSAPTEGPKKK